MIDLPTQPGVRIGNIARENLRFGFGVIADLLEVTLGPRGRMVAVERDSRKKAPELLSDGGVLARRVWQLPDQWQNMGLLMARNLAWKVEEEVGDGGTTAVILARRIIEEGMRFIAAGYDPMAIKRGLEKLAPVVIDAIKSQAYPLDNGKHIIALANNIVRNHDLAKHIHECFDVVGAQGAIEVRPSYSVTHDREYIQGAMWNKGWESSSFATRGGEAILSNPYILFTTYRISSASSLIPILQTIADQPDGLKHGLVVIAFNIEGEALNLLVMNKMRGALPTLALSAPGAGDERFEILQDLAILCGGVLISEEAGDVLESVNLNDLGRADEVRAVRSTFSVIGGKGRPVAIRRRITDIRSEYKNAPRDEQNLAIERAGKLLGGVALLRVGGATETEREYFKTRCEEAIRVIRSATQLGVVVGGGVVYARCAEMLDPILPSDEAIAVKMLKTALKQPLRDIIRNSGFDADAWVETILSQPNPLLGLDVVKGEMVNMIESHIVDPVNVLVTALRSAVSIAGMLLTTEALVHKPRSTRDSDVSLDP
jgi:chaperonin GroEL